MSEGPRDARRDPKAEDVFGTDDGLILTVEERRLKRPNEYLYGSGTAKDIVRYRIKQHPGMVFTQSTSGFKKRLKNAKVLKTSD